MSRFATKWIDWSHRQADVLTAESHFQRDLIPEPEIRRRVRVIPYGADHSLFPYGEKAAQTPIRFIHVANLNPVKDQETLIRCFAILAAGIDCSLTIIGPDYLNGKIQQLAEELGLNSKVRFLGFVPHSELREHFEEADIMLHTSLHEGMPVVAVEAMASGVIVCGTRVGIIADLAPDHCIAAPVGDHQALAGAVLQLLANHRQRETIRENARRWSEAHTIDWTAAQIVELYLDPSKKTIKNDE